MKYDYWLSRSLSSSKALALWQKGLSAEELYGMGQEKVQALTKLPELKLTETDLVRLTESRKNWDLDGEWQALVEKGIGFTSVSSDSYPSRLRPLTDAPFALFYMGRLPSADRKSIAIVGARGRSDYGCSVARKLSETLGACGIDVISGLALGIDTDGHTGCLDGGGTTYAVLGCGVDVIYPRSNAFLYHRILEKGGILSEYPPGTPAIGRQFPARNRIIAALADKVVVIEARLKSGSLITADYAMEQGKDVYALPGRITDELSQGTNKLIRQGAGALISVEDFLEELKVESADAYVQMDFRKNLLEKDELVVYSELDFCPVGLGSLMGKVSFELSELLDILMRLQRKGFIRESHPNYFVRCL